MMGVVKYFSMRDKLVSMPDNTDALVRNVSAERTEEGFDLHMCLERHKPVGVLFQSGEFQLVQLRDRTNSFQELLEDNWTPLPYEDEDQYIYLFKQINIK